MRKTTGPLATLDTMIQEAARRGLVLKTAEDEALDGRLVTVEGRSLVNFGSCSYLGLEMDGRLKQGAIDAVLRYGTQFSSSRTYLSSPLYTELEGLLARLFGAPVMVTSSTTLGHMATLPVVVGPEDAVILDQQVHNSVQMAANQARVQGTRVELIRHNRMDRLEERIVELRRQHRKIWYMADGVYSMYGNLAPVETLANLLDRYEELNLYVDDAHGMSWSGPNGRGYFLTRMPMRDRLVVATSLNKAFAAAGGAFIFPSEELRDKVLRCGGPMIFSGPVQPPMLGVAVASAKLHLTGEIHERQALLSERMALCNRLLRTFGVPVVAEPETPIRFIGVGLPRVGYNLVERLIQEGFHTNLATFPAVPMPRAGVRFTLTTHQTFDDVERLCSAIARHLPLALAEEGSSLEEVHRTFDLAAPRMPPRTLTPGFELTVSRGLRLETHRTIESIDAAEWDRLLGDRGSFSHAGLRTLERAFQGNERPEENWGFHYHIVRQPDGSPMLATFFTDALWKDDMLAPERVSRRIEARRAADPYFLTSRTMAMGSLLTEGDHLYLDRQADWKAALAMVLRAASEAQRASGATALVLRDLPEDPELEAFLADEGFTRSGSVESMVLDLPGGDEQALWASLPSRYRRHVKQQVLSTSDRFETRVLRGSELEPALLAHLHQLYRNVLGQRLELNTFGLPLALWASVAGNPAWELVLFHPPGESASMPVGFVATHVGEHHVSPMVLGLDYRYVSDGGLYRRCLLEVVRRAQAHGVSRVMLGFGAELEKRRLGARGEVRHIYAQASDHFHHEQLALFEGD